MASLRNLYEERQRSHQHTLPGDSKQVICVYFMCTQTLHSLLFIAHFLSPLHSCPVFLPNCQQFYDRLVIKQIEDITGKIFSSFHLHRHSCCIKPVRISLSLSHHLALSLCLSLFLSPCTRRCVRRQLRYQWRHSSRVAVGSVLSSSRAEPSARSLSPWRASGR